MMEQNSEIPAEQAAPHAELDPEETKPASRLTFFGALTQLARGRRLVAVAGGIGMLLGIVVSLVLRPQYTATTRIMTPQQTQSAASLLMSQLALNSSVPSQLAAATGGTTLSLRNPNELYMGLLASRPIADAIVDKFGLMDVYRAKDRTAARKSLADNTTIASEKSTLISISVTDTDKSRAAAIANAYPEQLRSLTKTIAVTEASQRRLFYEQQLKDANDDLVAAELAFERIEKQKGLIQLDAQTKALIASLADLHAQVTAKEVQLEALRSYSTEQNPEVQLLESQLASLRDQETRMGTRGSGGAAGMDLEDVAGAGSEYLRAEHELQYRQALYDLLLKQYDAARWDEAKNAAIVQVVEQAVAPDRKSAPHRLVIVLVFTLLGLLGAWLYVLGRNLAANHPRILELLGEFKSVPVND
ncbi:MAG: GumC family protein [Terracidiphilus sp.]